MTFLNAILLGGAVAALIPLIIHLFFRRRFKIVHWGAMHFLEAVLRTNQRRFRIQQVVLLLVRIAVPLVLAACMARPVLTGARSLVHRAMSSVVLLLDNSYSMEAGEAVRSNFAVARETAGTLAGQLPRGSEVAVVGLAGPLPDGLGDPGYDLDGVVRKLEGATGGFGAADVPGRLETAAGLFATRLHHADRTLVLISDFQAVSWARTEAPARARAMELLAAQPVPPRVILFPVGREVRENVAVESVETTKTLPGVGQKLMARANLRNHGAHAVNDLRVFFRVDGTERAVNQLSLGPGETGQLIFPLTFDRPGSHVLEVTADADPLKADNTGLLSLPALDKLPALIVSGDQRTERLQGETAFLELALRPFGAAREKMADLIEPRTVAENAFTPETLAGARVVILANVRQLEDRMVEALQGFVRDGGGLLVFPGDRVNAAWYNDRLVGDGSGLLPARFGALAGSLDGSSPPAAIVAQHYAHPALAVFNDPRKGSMQGAQLRAWYRLEAPADAQKAALSTVFARLDTGDAFLAEKPYGQGRVVLCSVPCDADWSNLPLRPFYLPLVQELTVHLASQVYPPRNIRAGERLAALLPAADVGRKATWVDPEGRTVEREVAASGLRGTVEFTGTARPGLYLLKTPGGETIHFVVRTPVEESRLDRLGTEELQALAKELNGTVVRTADEYRTLEQERRWGREIWKSLLLAVLILLFTELLLVPWFLKMRPALSGSGAATERGPA